MILGKCLCQAIRFEITGNLGPVVCCHCAMCRRASGSAFAVNASLRAHDVRFVAGWSLIVEFESSPGKFRAFCSRCGSPIYSRREQIPEMLRLRLGLIDGDLPQRPSAHIFVASKAPWFEIADQLPRFDGEPPQEYELLEHFAGRNS